MKLSPEAFERALTELADRADAHPVADRVPAVRGRARRTARRRAGAVVMALLIVIGAGAAGFGGLPSLRGQGEPAKPTNRPYLNIQLVRNEAREATRPLPNPEGRILSFDVVIHGRVPRWTGYRPGDDARVNLSEIIVMTDGTDTIHVRDTQGGFRCAPGAPLENVDLTIPVNRYYPPGSVTPVLGSHDLALSVGACPPVGLVLAKLRVVMK